MEQKVRETTDLSLLFTCCFELHYVLSLFFEYSMEIIISSIPTTIGTGTKLKFCITETVGNVEDRAEFPKLYTKFRSILHVSCSFPLYKISILFQCGLSWNIECFSWNDIFCTATL